MPHFLNTKDLPTNKKKALQLEPIKYFSGLPGLQFSQHWYSKKSQLSVALDLLEFGGKANLSRDLVGGTQSKRLNHKNAGTPPMPPPVPSLPWSADPFLGIQIASGGLDS